MYSFDTFERGFNRSAGSRRERSDLLDLRSRVLRERYLLRSRVLRSHPDLRSRVHRSREDDRRHLGRSRSVRALRKLWADEVCYRRIRITYLDTIEADSESRLQRKQEVAQPERTNNIQPQTVLHTHPIHYSSLSEEAPLTFTYRIVYKVP